MSSLGLPRGRRARPARSPPRPNWRRTAKHRQSRVQLNVGGGAASTVSPSAITLSRLAGPTKHARLHRRVPAGRRNPRSDDRRSRHRAVRDRPTRVGSPAGGARGSSPLCTLSSRARSDALRAIGPSVTSCAKNASLRGHEGTRPCDGRRPKTLFQPAGFRSDPPRSLPSAIGSIRCETATAAPPLDPPALNPGFHAFPVAPKIGL
jgi:hypothetical protein